MVGVSKRNEKLKTIAQLETELQNTSNPVTRSVLNQIINKKLDAMIISSADKAKAIFVDDLT